MCGDSLPRAKGGTGHQGGRRCLAAPCLGEQTPALGAWRWLLWVHGPVPPLPGLYPEQHHKAEPDGVGFPLAGGMPCTVERCILAGDVGDEIRMGIALPASDPSLRLIRQDRQLLLLDPGSAV